MRDIRIFFGYNFLLLLLTLTSCQVYADIKADIFAKARIELLQNRIDSLKEQIKCKNDYPENYKQQTNCMKKLADTYMNIKLPASLGDKLAKLIKPDVGKITTQCINELGDAALPAEISNCKGKTVGKFFQTVALIRSGTVPESYFDPEYSENANTDLTNQMGVLQKQVESFQERLRQKALVLFTDMECEASEQTDAWKRRPDCQHRYNLEAPVGYQYCKSISETGKGSRPNKDNAVKLTWEYIYFDDVAFNDGTKKVKGRYVVTHATGGPWYDKYSAVSRAQAVILFTNINSSRSGLMSIGCYTPPKATLPLPEAPTPESSPYMDISMNVKNNPDVAHTGTLTISAEGVPPYSINYLVEALREDKWHEVLKGNIKLTKPSSTTIRDVYWYKAEGWRVKRL
ncbi:hypothetical protein [Neptunomonas japonica]|uniref:hypothetical protein n=1 Tax=Neptunomonas japonica TaxID=417574 RepID=UPI0004297230|nr:hypothetical protein [Neptunomonas japonica]